MLAGLPYTRAHTPHPSPSCPRESRENGLPRRQLHSRGRPCLPEAKALHHCHPYPPGASLGPAPPPFSLPHCPVPAPHPSLHAPCTAGTSCHNCIAAENREEVPAAQLYGEQGRCLLSMNLASRVSHRQRNFGLSGQGGLTTCPQPHSPETFSVPVRASWGISR